jgi:hypothetical protein
MKTVKLSLSALLLASCSVSAFAGDSLSDAFKNGKIKGQLKAINYNVDKGSKGKESILSLGVMLNYVTGDFYGFSAGFRFQSSDSPWASSEAKNFYKADLYGPGAVLEEAYLKYKYKKSSLKIGRQFIQTPLLAGNGSRIIHESFEGYTATTKELPKTKIFVGYVDKYLTRTNFKGANGGGVGKFDKKIFMYGAKYKYTLGDGIWTALVQNQTIKGLKLTGQYLKIKNATIAKTGKTQGDISVGLAQAEYKFKAAGLGMLAGIQYGSSNVDNDNSVSGDLLGFKLATKYNGFITSLGYTIANKDKGMVSGVGISSNWAYAGDIIGLENYQKDVDALSLNLKYKFAKNIMFLGRYTDYMVGSNGTLNGGKDLNAYDLIASYKFKNALKGLGVKFHFEDVEYDKNPVKNYRLYLTYNF